MTALKSGRDYLQFTENKHLISTRKIPFDDKICPCPKFWNPATGCHTWVALGKRKNYWVLIIWKNPWGIFSVRVIYSAESIQNSILASFIHFLKLLKKLHYFLDSQAPRLLYWLSSSDCLTQTMTWLMVYQMRYPTLLKRSPSKLIYNSKHPFPKTLWNIRCVEGESSFSLSH